MATNAQGGKLTWVLDADSTKLDASLTKAQSGAKKTATEMERAGNTGKAAADKLGSSWSANLTNIQGKLGGVTAGMERFALKALGVTTAVGGLALVGLKSAASLEQVETNLFAISGSADFAREGLEKLRKISMDTAGFSVGGLSSVTLGLKNIYGSAQEAIKQTEVLARMISATGGTEQDLQGVVSALQMISVSGKAGTRQFKALFQASPLFSEIATKAGLTADSLEQSADPLKELTAAFGEAAKEGGMLQAAIDAQNNTLKDAWDDATENFMLSFGTWIRTSGLVELVKEALADFQVWLTANGPEIAKRIKEGFEWILDNKGAIIAAVKAFVVVWGTLKLANVAINIYKVVAAFTAFLKLMAGLTLVKGLLSALTANIGSLAVVGNVLKAVLGALTGVVGLVIAAIAIWAYNIYQIATHWRDFRDLIVAGIAWLQGVALALYNVGVAMIQGFVNGIKAAAAGVWNGIKEAADKIGQFFAGAGSWLYDTGKNIVQGLVNGIKDMAGAVTDTVSNIGSGIKNRFKSILGIASPSKVFAGYGENIVQGLEKGIGVGVSGIQANITGMAGAVTESPLATGGIDLAPQGLTNDSSQTITIGTINIAKEVDGEKWLQRLNRNTELAGQGMVGATNG